MAEKLLTWH